LSEQAPAKKATGVEDVKEFSPHEEAPFAPMWQKPGESEPAPGSAVIVHDVVLFAHTATALLHCFICMIKILEHHHVTIKLHKTRFFPLQSEFIGVNMMKEGDSPAQSKHEALKGLDRPLVCWRSFNRTVGDAQIQKVFNRTRVHNVDCPCS
jgi:hypothetical protein